MNKVILIGRLTANPSLKQTPSGTSVATFSLAVPRSYNRDTVDFVNIVAWKHLADFSSKYIKKGQQVAIEGELQTRSYEDKQGNKKIAYEVVANSIEFTGKKEKTQNQYNQGNIVSQDFNADEYEEIEEDNDLTDFD